MCVIDHFFYAGLYLPAWSCFTDCPCSRGWSPYGMVVYWRFDYTADEVLLFLWRNLLEEEHYSTTVDYKPFTRLSLNSKSVFRCSNMLLAQAGVLSLHRNPPLPSWTSGCLPHPPESSAERECLLWCKTASARCNHNTFLLCLLYAVVNAL